MPPSPLPSTPHAPDHDQPVAWSARPAPADLRDRLVGVVAAGPASSGGAALLLLPTIVLTAVLAAGTLGTSPSAVGPTPAGETPVAAGASSRVGIGEVVDVAGRPATAPVAPQMATGPAAPQTAAAPVPAASSAPTRFASFEDLQLFLPSNRAMISGFHEASYRYALRMRPWGTPLASDNPRKEAKPPVDDGPNYAILSSRGRPTQATSAVDVAVPRNAPIASPVTGTVVSVRPYELYGRYADTRIEVRPKDRPDLVVTVLHVSDPQVRTGDEVVGGKTRIAGKATAFPFRSHVDAYAGGRPPHVHIELKRG